MSDSVSGLSDTEHDLRIITDALMAAANAIVICDPKGRILKVNTAFTTMTGYTSREALGRSTKILKSGNHAEKFYREMWQTIERGEVWRGEIVNKRKDGTLYTEDMTITPVFSDDGVIENYIAIKQDVSEQKQLEEMFLRAQRLESVGTMVSGVAHDLNNVLSPIMMSAELMSFKSEDPEVLEMASMVKDGAKRGADIVKQLLSFARGSETGVVEVQLRHLLKELMKMYRQTFPKSIVIDGDVEKDVGMVSGDNTQLSQVFTNLMINARDAMPEGGTLTVQLSRSDIDMEFVKKHSTAQMGSFVRVRFRDTGTGMTEDVQAKIYDSFFTTKLQGKGTGLGLPTSLSIVKRHGGFLVVESKPGEGTTFDVFLPVSVSESQKTTLASSGPLKGNGETVLVVDDETSVGYMLKSTLGSLGYTVQLATSGKEALDWLAEHSNEVDLVLLDVMMPEVDGTDVFQKLQKEIPSLTVLFMSGVGGEEIFESLHIDPEIHFISKPFTISALAEKVQGAIAFAHDQSEG